MGQGHAKSASLPLRFAPVGNDTQRYLRVIPGEPQAREGDRVQDVARIFPPPCGEGSRVGVAKSKLCCFNEERRGRYSSSPLPQGDVERSEGEGEREAP